LLRQVARGAEVADHSACAPTTTAVSGRLRLLRTLSDGVWQRDLHGQLAGRGHTLLAEASGGVGSMVEKLIAEAYHSNPIFVSVTKVG
jgi:hypothetical protein